MLLITLFTSLTAGYIQRVRQEARDVKRVADLGQVRAALTLYEHAQGKYPLGKNVTIGADRAVALDHRGWVASPEEPVYLSGLMPDPLPSASLPCVKSVSQPCAYNYSSSTGTDFSIRFYLEHGVSPLSAPGTYQLTSQGYRP
jgi:hypothetical protein